MGRAREGRNEEEAANSCLRCGGCRDFHALPVDGVRLSRAGSARARGDDDCVGTFQTGSWNVGAERRQVAENRLCSVGFQGVRLPGMAVKAHDLSEGKARSRASSAVPAARPPPPLTPAIRSRSGSMPSSSAFFAIHTSPA